MEADSDDASLIEASLVDPGAFGGLFDRHAPSLLGYLIRRVGATDGELLLSELFRIAFEARHRYQRDRADARPWLYGIAAKLVMKHLRTEGRRRTAMERLAARRDTTPPFDERVSTEMATVELWPRVAAAINQLPEHDREVILLYAWEELTYAQIAEALDIPIGTVRSRLNRIRGTLRELVVDYGQEPDVPTHGAGGGATR